MVAGSDDHEVGGMNGVNAAAAAAGGSGVLIDVRFAKADMSAKYTAQIRKLTVTSVLCRITLY